MDYHLSSSNGEKPYGRRKEQSLPFKIMVKNVYECLMSLQCLLCRGLAGGRGKMAVLGHWGGDGEGLVD